MAESTEDVLVTIGTALDEAGLNKLEAELKKVGVNLKKTGDDGKLSLEKVDAGVQKVGKSFIDFAAKVAVAYGAITKLTNAWITQAKADARLELAIKNNTTALTRQGKSVKDVTADFKKFAAERERLTNIDDAETQSLQALLTSLGELPENVNNVTSAFQDLAVGTGKSANELVNKWKKVGDARVTASELVNDFREAGVQLNETELTGISIQQRKEVILKAINAKYKDNAVVTAAAEGEVGKFNTTIGNLMESLGKLVVNVLSPMFRGLSAIIDPFIQLPGVVQAAIIALIAFGGIAAAAAASGTALSVALTNIVRSMGPIGWVIAGLGTLATVIGLFSSESNGLDKVAASMDAIGNSIKKIKQVDKTVESLDDMLKKLKGMKPGSEQYIAAVNAMISSNNLVRSSNVSAADSYNSIILKIKEAATAMKTASAFKLVQDAKKSKDDFSVLLTELYTFERKVHREGATLTPEENIRYKFVESQVAQMLAMYQQTDELTEQLNGAGLGTKFFDEAVNKPLLRAAAHSHQRIMAMKSGFLRLAAEAERGPNSTYDPPGGTGDPGSTGVKETMDLWQLRIDLMEDEFEKRRAQNVKNYMEEEDRINALALHEKFTQADKDEALSLNRQKQLQTEAQIKKDEEEERKRQEEKAHQERIKMINEIGNLTTEAFSISTSLFQKDFKGAISQGLSLIPEIGTTLSGVFGAAVGFFTEIFSSNSKTEAEKLGIWLEQAIERFDAAFKESETYTQLLGGSSSESIESEVTTATNNLSEALAKLGLNANMSRKDFKKFYDYVTKADFSKVDWNKYTASGTFTTSGRGTKPVTTIRTGNIFQEEYFTNMSDDYATNLANQIRQFFTDTYGEFGDEMMTALGLTGSDRDIFKKWSTKTRKDLTGLNAGIKAIAESTAEWFDKLEDATLKKGLEKPMSDLDKINDKLKLGTISQEEWKSQALAIIDESLAYLATLDQTEEVIDAITALQLKRLDIEKGITEETDKQLMNEEQRARAAKIQALEDDIRYGRRKDTEAAQRELANLYMQQLSSYASSGLKGTSLYTDLEEKIREQTLGVVGQAGYNALSGTGLNTNLGLVDRKAPSYVIKVDGRNTNSSQTIINSPITLPPDLVNYILRSTYSQSGRGF